MKESIQKSPVSPQHQSSGPSSASVLAPEAVPGLLESPRIVMQRKAMGGASGGAAPPPGAGSSGSKGLPASLTHGIAALSGMDLSDVRVHRDSPKPAQIGALAFAQNNEIHLGRGQDKHLPHEAWHIVQQRQGRVNADKQTKGGRLNTDPALEHEADVWGGKAAAVGASALPPVTPIVRRFASRPAATTVIQRKEVTHEEFNAAAAGCTQTLAEYCNTFRPDRNKEGFLANILQPAIGTHLLPRLSTKVFTQLQSDLIGKYGKDKTLGYESQHALVSIVEGMKEENKANLAQVGPEEAAWRDLRLKILAQKSSPFHYSKLDSFKEKSDAVRGQSVTELVRRGVESKLRLDDSNAKTITNAVYQAGAPIFKNALQPLALAFEQEFGIRLSPIKGMVQTPDVKLNKLHAWKSEMDGAFDENVAKAREIVAQAMMERKLWDAIKEQVRIAYKLKGFNENGRDTDRQDIASSTAEMYNDTAARSEVVAAMAGKLLESNLSSWSQRMGKALDLSYSKVGDYGTLELGLSIPVAPMVSIELGLSCEIEKDEDGTTIAADVSVGVSGNFYGFFSVQFTFGGYVEACGKDAVHALELLSYHFYKRCDAKDEVIKDKIWGTGNIPGSAATWARYVESKMTENHSVERGEHVSLSASLGNALTGELAFSVGTSLGTLYSKEGSEVSETRVSGWSVSFEGKVGAGSGSLEVARLKCIPKNDPSTVKRVTTIEASISKELEDSKSVYLLIDPTLTLVDKALQKLKNKVSAEDQTEGEKVDLAQSAKAELRELIQRGIEQKVKTTVGDTQDASIEANRTKKKKGAKGTDADNTSDSNDEERFEFTSKALTLGVEAEKEDNGRWKVGVFLASEQATKINFGFGSIEGSTGRKFNLAKDVEI